MKLGLKKGQKGFTLIEILIVLAILGILAAIAIPNLIGFLAQGKERGWEGDQHLLLAAVNGWRSDIRAHPGNQYPVTDNRTIGVPTDNGTNGSFADSADIKRGIIDIGKLSTGNYITGTDAVTSASSDRGQIGATNSPSGSYVWYITANSTIQSLYWDGSAWQTGFQSGVYP